jgi:hypothetical protein
MSESSRAGFAGGRNRRLHEARTCEVVLDRERSFARWPVDGRKVYEAHGTLIPERASIGFGIWTMLPIRDCRGRSLDGQG